MIEGQVEIVDERRARIQDDLRGLLRGEILLEPLELSAYSVDGSLYEIEPLAVIIPKNEGDVVETVRYASENEIPIHPRGAGTGVSGSVLGPGLVIDFSKHLRRVIRIEPDRVVAQPGVVCDVLNRWLAPLGRRIGPDPEGSAVATIGGMAGLDSAGPSSLRYGSMGDHVERMRVVFARGEAAEVGHEFWPGFDTEDTDYKSSIVRRLGSIVRRNLDVLVRTASLTPRNRAGYALAKAATGMGIHLPRLIVGSEGTLAAVTEITLRTVPLPPCQAAVLLPFSRILDAAAEVSQCLDSSPVACNLHDWRTIRLAREAHPQYREWIHESAESVLILLFEGEDHDEVAWRAQSLATKIAKHGHLVADPVLTTKRLECDQLLHLRRLVEPSLMRLKGKARLLPIIDDVAVPPEQLGAMIQNIQSIMRALDVSWTLDANAGHGQLHVRPFLDPSSPSDIEKFEPLAIRVHQAALSLQGSISGESGSGLVRSQFLKQQFGDLYPVFRDVKNLFDPLNLFNPGKVIGDSPNLITENLRRFPDSDLIGAHAEPSLSSFPFEFVSLPPAVETPPRESRGVILPVLRWEERGPIAEASACNGCGACRTRDWSSRMCPTFRASRSEAATPRAKANLVRQIASGSLDPKLWGTEEFKKHADLCIHCNLCSKDCPSGVDVSRLMIEAKAAFVEDHGLPPTEWALSRVEHWAKIASRIPIFTNAFLANRPARWLLERLMGLSRLRRIPRVHRTPFTRRSSRLGLSKPRPHEPGPRVVYFVDVFANYFDQELAESVVGVLRHAGVNVFVPTNQHDSGMPALVSGDIDYARELALKNLRVLGNAVRDGYTVVCSEPTATLMLQQEYLRLTDDLDAALVAANTLDIGAYLTGLEARGQLPKPDQPVRAKVGYHQPCHHRALEIGTPGLDLIRKIPEIDVEFIDRGCSGMAGTFGLHRDHFRTSLRAGRALLSRLSDADLQVGSTECGACRVQMEQSSTKRTLHPLKLLALSYGLSPSLRRQLKELNVPDSV